MTGVRHVWVRRNYGQRWMPGLVLEWRSSEVAMGVRWDALCIVTDRERSWVEWFGHDELVPVQAEEPPAPTG